MGREHWNSYFLTMLSIIGIVVGAVWAILFYVNSVAAADQIGRQALSVELAALKAQQQELMRITDRLDSTSKMLTTTIADQSISAQKSGAETSMAIVKLQQLVEDRLSKGK